MRPLALLVVLLMLAGCADPQEPAPDDQAAAAADEEGAAGSGPSNLAADGAEASSPPAFAPVSSEWDGSTEQGACVVDGTSWNCVGAPFGDCCNRVEVPAGARQLALVVTWEDPLGRMLNLAVYGLGEQGVVAQGASPLTLDAPVAGGSTEAQVYLAQYVADAGAAHATSQVEFHVEATFTA